MELLALLLTKEHQKVIRFKLNYIVSNIGLDYR